VAEEYVEPEVRWRDTPDCYCQVVETFAGVKSIEFCPLHAHADKLFATLDSINIAACYASEENINARAEALLHIGARARGAMGLVEGQAQKTEGQT
jgi:hypothetical protein